MKHGDNPARVKAMLQLAFAGDIGTSRPNDSRFVGMPKSLLHPSCQRYRQYVDPENLSCEFHKSVWRRIESRKKCPGVGLELFLTQKSPCLTLTVNPGEEIICRESVLRNRCLLERRDRVALQ